MSLGWSLLETKELFKAVERKNGASLNSAFRAIAVKYNRKPNSVRNYYYSQLKAFSLLPDMARSLGISPLTNKKQFETFSENEVTELVKHVLIEQAKGKSVRCIVQCLAEGNKTTMLRLQNKYRAVIASKRGRLNAILAQLNSEGATYRNPITGEIVVNGEAKQKTSGSSVEIAELRTLIEHALRQIEGLQQSNMEKSKQLEGMHSNAMLKNQQIEDMRSNAMLKNQQIENMRSSVLQKNQEIEDMRSSVLQKNQEIERLQTANSALAQKILSLKK